MCSRRAPLRVRFRFRGEERPFREPILLNNSRALRLLLKRRKLRLEFIPGQNKVVLVPPRVLQVAERGIQAALRDIMQLAFPQELLLELTRPLPLFHQLGPERGDLRAEGIEPLLRVRTDHAHGRSTLVRVGFESGHACFCCFQPCGHRRERPLLVFQLLVFVF